MDVSLFLAKLIGFYFIVIALLSVFRSRQMMATGKELVGSKSALAVSGEISLLFGLVIAIDHTVWQMNWRGLITLIGYLMIFRGILRFAFPNRVKGMVAKMTKRGYYYIVGVMFIIGAYLTYCGFNG